jgi:hypothetical protein
MSESKSSVPSIRRAPAWETNTPQQPTVAIQLGLSPNQQIPAAQVAAGTFNGNFAFSGTETAAGITSTAGVAVGGALTGATTGSFSGEIVSKGGYLPPVYNSSGADPSSGSGTIHEVVQFAIVSCVGGTLTITLTGAAVFSGTNTYQVVAQGTGGGVTEIFSVTNNSASQFTVTSNVATAGFNWRAIGY